MFAFNVTPLSRCDSAITLIKAIKVVDEDASGYVNVARRGVEIEPDAVTLAELDEALAVAEFKPELLPEGQGWFEGILVDDQQGRAAHRGALVRKFMRAGYTGHVQL